MSSVGCPRCSETFRIPDASLPEGVQVRCPWCTEIFQIGEIANHLPPMAELLDADHQPISLSTVSQAFELAAASAGGTNSSPFLPSSSDQDLNPNASYGEPNFLDDTDDQAIGLQEAKEQAGSRLKWSERLGWTPDPSAAVQPMELDDLEPEVAGEELLTFDSDEDHLNEGPDVADPFITLDENARLQREPHAPEPYEGFEEYDDDPFEAEDSDSDNGSAYELGSHAGVAVTGPVAPRPLSSASAESKVSPSLNAKPRAKKKSSPVKQIIGVVLGGLASLPLAYGVLWAFGKAPSLEGVPFIGEAQKKLAGTPRAINDDQSQGRNNYDPGRSLAADLPSGPLDSGQEASASDTGDSEPATDAVSTDPVSTDASSLPDPAGSGDTEVVVDTAGGSGEEMIDLPAIPTSTEAAETVEDKKPAIASTEPMLELPKVSEIEPTALSPAKPEPATPEPAKPEPATPESTTAEPVAAPEKSEPITPEPAMPPAVKPEPAAAPVSPQYLASLKAAQDAMTSLDQAKQQKAAASDLKNLKGTLYRSVAAMAVAPQQINQPQTAKFIESLSEKGLLLEMTAVGPAWLNAPSRSNNAGLLVSGDARELPAGWTMACQGAKGNVDIKLEGVPDGLLKNGDKVVLLGRIENATAPATVQCVFIKVQKAKSAAKP